jgi:hypothetical protein
MPTNGVTDNATARGDGMAEVITTRGVRVKKRNPWAVWALSVATLGVYGAVYWNRINVELRDYSAAVGQPFGNQPGRATLAIFPGGLLVLPALGTIVHTAGRVRRLQWMTAPLGGAVREAGTPMAVLLGVAFNLHLVYLQSALNDCWDRALDAEQAPARTWRMPPVAEAQAPVEPKPPSPRPSEPGSSPTSLAAGRVTGVTTS